LKISKLIDSLSLSPEKTRGEDMKVSPIMLLKTHIEEMSENGHAIISMKIQHIEVARHYVYEK
jgi:hypothetical protein